MFRDHPNLERVRLNKRAQNHPRLDDGMPISVKPYWTRLKRIKVLSLHPIIIKELIRKYVGTALFNLLASCPSLEELDISPDVAELGQLSLEELEMSPRFMERGSLRML